MTKADTYRQFAAECTALAQRHENANDKARLVAMAEKWLRLAGLAEKHEGTAEGKQRIDE